MLSFRTSDLNGLQISSMYLFEYFKLRQDKWHVVFRLIDMELDQNEKKLIEKLTSALNLLNANEKDLRMISGAKKIDANFLEKAANIFDNTEACTVCRHAFHSWRNTLDDETVLSFIDDWINWKTKNPGADSTITTSK